MDTSKIYMFKNVNSQLYMNVAGGSTDDGTNIQQWGGNPAEPQTYNSFTLKAFSGGGNYYYIMSRLGNYCLKAVQTVEISRFHRIPPRTAPCFSDL